MAYIEPNTDIYLLKGYPCNRDYAHTLWFENDDSQRIYFMSLVKPSDRYVYRLSNYTYQRVSEGVVRVAIPADYVRDINYMMFKNTAYGNKWFYAFVNDVRYINDNASEVSYEIDPIQTYLFDIKINDCFVERMHSQSDGLYENLVAEDMPATNFMLNKIEMSNENPNDLTEADFEKYAFVFAMPYDLSKHDWSRNPVEPPSWDDMKADGQIYNNVPTGTFYNILPSNYTYEFNKIILWINVSEAIANSVLSIFVIPLELFEYEPMADGSIWLRIKNSTTKKCVFKRPTKLGKYTPKNKKMLISPYNNAVIGWLNSNCREIEFEKWCGTSSDLICSFITAIYPGMTATLYPDDYAGVASSLENSVDSVNYPIGAFKNDLYNQWLNRVVVSGIFDIASSFIGGKAGTAINAVNKAVKASKTFMNISTTKPIKNTTIDAAEKRASKYWDSDVDSAITGTVSSALELGKNVLLAKRSFPQTVKGNSTQDIYIAHNLIKPVLYQSYLIEDEAKRVDDYFTMYGYAQMKIMTPSIHNRDRFTYVQTYKSNITSRMFKGVPAVYLSFISSKFDSGITFWSDVSTIYNYELDNDPIGV